MKFSKVTAIIPDLALEKVEKNLTHLGVSGMTVSTVHGFGEYRNYFTRDFMSDCRRVEVFTESEKVNDIIRVIADTVYKDLGTDGVVAVVPVEDFFHIRDYIDREGNKSE